MRPSIDLNRILSEARSARRLSVRLALESIAETHSQDEVWMWMAVLADTPSGALDLLQKAGQSGPIAEVALAAGLWLDYLNSPEETMARLTAKPNKTLNGKQFLATCPTCRAQLAARATALGNSRNCPGCGAGFTIPSTLPE